MDNDGVFRNATIPQLETILSMVDDMDDDAVAIWHRWAFNDTRFIDGTQVTINRHLYWIIKQKEEIN